MGNRESGLGLYFSKKVFFIFTMPIVLFSMPANAYWLMDAFDLGSKASHYSQSVSLLSGWEIVSDDIDQHIPTYNRRDQFGSWRLIDGCHDTRAAVLIRDDDDGQVERSARWNCHVTKGQWLDPYTGKWIYQAPEAHIDHVIPLKNAYESGAWGWSQKKRCHFANYMENDFHLLTVSAFENRSKGERGPDQYLPDDPDFHCSYVKLWLAIKKIWNLKVFEAEYEAIMNLYRNGTCSARTAKISRSSLNHQRYLASRIPDHCMDVH